MPNQNNTQQCAWIIWLLHLKVLLKCVHHWTKLVYLLQSLQVKPWERRKQQHRSSSCVEDWTVCPATPGCLGWCPVTHSIHCKCLVKFKLAFCVTKHARQLSDAVHWCPVTQWIHCTQALWTTIYWLVPWEREGERERERETLCILDATICGMFLLVLLAGRFSSKCVSSIAI